MVSFFDEYFLIEYSIKRRKISSGLFHKAIMQSGVLWCSWCKNENYSVRGFRLAALLGEKSKDPEEVVEFLRKVPAEDIVKVQSNIVTIEVRNFSILFHD